MYSIRLLFLFLLFLTSCQRAGDKDVEDSGVPTILKGNVSDDIRGVKIPNYKIKLIKSWSCCSNWMCGICSKEVGTAYTDSNGDFVIKFNYKLNEGETYGLEEQYYGFPYAAEYKFADKITAGKENFININAWKPVLIKLNLNVINNDNGPLVVGLNYKGSYAFGTEFIYEKNIIKTVQIRTRPNSNIKIDFWYNKGKDAWGNSIRHLKQYDYTTNLDDETTLNFDIDCSKF